VSRPDLVTGCIQLPLVADCVQSPINPIIKLIYWLCYTYSVPTKAAGSHPVSALVALVAGSVLSKYVWELLPPVGTASQAVLTLTNSYVPVPTNSKAAGALVIFLGVTVVWEAAHYIREK
jgi:hypothetical protein